MSAQQGIERLDAKTVRERFAAGAFAIAEDGGSVSAALARAHARGATLMIEGEVGTGVRDIAELVYLQGPYAGEPLVEVAVPTLSERSWRHLVKGIESPLFQVGLTVLLDGVNALDVRRANELASALSTAAASRGCRLILTGDEVPGGGEAPATTLLADRLGCAVSIAPALRDQEDVSGKLVRYLVYLAASFGTAAPSVDARAARMLEGYTWPRNYMQLREVAERLYISVGEGVIDADAVEEVLGQEAVIKTATFSAPTLDSDLYILRPLADTERDIARMVVEHLGGNKTRAAEVLGISRTTLWRMLG